MSILLKQWATGIAGGQSWNSYWATRFPSALQAVPFSGTRIDLGWTNNGDQNYDYISIEGSTDGVNYSEYETVTTGDATANITGLTEITDYWFRVRYIKTGNGSAYTSVVQSLTYATAIFDGHTLLWIPHEDSSIFTLSGSDITEVTDKLGSGRKFIGGTVKPTLGVNGIYLPDQAAMTATFNFSATYTMYVVMAVHEYRAYMNLLRIHSTDDGVLFQDANNKYQYRNGTSGNYVNQSNAGLDTYCVFMVGCNAAALSGFFRIDGNAAAGGYVGISDITSIRFNSLGAPGNYVNFTIKEIILRDQYEYNTGTLTSLYNYLVKKK